MVRGKEKEGILTGRREICDGAPGRGGICSLSKKTEGKSCLWDKGSGRRCFYRVK